MSVFHAHCDRLHQIVYILCDEKSSERNCLSHKLHILKVKFILIRFRVENIHQIHISCENSIVYCIKWTFFF